LIEVIKTLKHVLFQYCNKSIKGETTRFEIEKHFFF